MVLVKKAVNIDWLPARAWVAPEAGAADDAISVDDDNVCLGFVPKCLLENGMPSQLTSSRSFRFGGS
eukprot:1552640-Pleurochrysis_carterae.AAC.7